MICDGYNERDVLTGSSIFFALSLAQGSAATADIYVCGEKYA